MKLNCGLILSVMAATSLLAQPATNAPEMTIQTPPPAPAATNAPSVAPAKAAAPAAKSAKKKKAAPKQAPAKKRAAPKAAQAVAELKTVPLTPGPAYVVASNVNVRGQAKLKSEVVTRVTKGQEVIVLEELVNNLSAPSEPSAWARIALPANTPVYVNGTYLDANKAVIATKLNARSGPGQNYSILCTLAKGEVVKQIGTKGDWLEIEAPTNAYAFIAAQFLTQEKPAVAPAIAAATPTPTPTPPPTPEPAPTPATVTEPPAVAVPPTNAPVVETPPLTNAPIVAAVDTNAPALTETNAPAEDEPPPKRIVDREGIVHGTTSIQAPTKFGLVSLENGRMIDYLFTTSTNLDLRRYKGLRIIVTGEEGLDERWGNTPVITIQRIQVIE